MLSKIKMVKKRTEQNRTERLKQKEHKQMKNTIENGITIGIRKG